MIRVALPYSYAIDFNFTLGVCESTESSSAVRLRFSYTELQNPCASCCFISHLECHSFVRSSSIYCFCLLRQLILHCLHSSSRSFAGHHAVTEYLHIWAYVLTCEATIDHQANSNISWRPKFLCSIDHKEYNERMRCPLLHAEIGLLADPDGRSSLFQRLQTESLASILAAWLLHVPEGFSHSQPDGSRPDPSFWIVVPQDEHERSSKSSSSGSERGHDNLRNFVSR